MKKYQGKRSMIPCLPIKSQQERNHIKCSFTMYRKIMFDLTLSVNKKLENGEDTLTGILKM